jgi:hemerythrin-like domain-containing protein
MPSKRESSAIPSARRSALAIIEAEHAAFDGALSWITGHLTLTRAHRIAADPGVFEQGLAFIATFMESFHHPKEDEYLFRAVRERTREADEILATLQQQHAEIPGEFRNLRLALSGGRQGGRAQLNDFAELIGRFAHSQTEHMHLESGVFATAERVLLPSDWKGIDVAFRANRDPLFGSGPGGFASIMVRAG